jgi:cell wall-associated NlpC family hydrolase
LVRSVSIAVFVGALAFVAAPSDARTRDIAPAEAQAAQVAIHVAPVDGQGRASEPGAANPAVATPADVSPAADGAESESAVVDAPDIPMWTSAPSSASSEINRIASRLISRTSSIAQSLTRNAMRFIGTPYVFGGTSPSGFDCSGYTQHVFAMLGIHLPRTADAQYFAGHRIKDQMVVGDLVFFQTYEPGPSHVGIYVGDGKFIHSSSHGVMISRLNDSYWARRYLGAKRFLAER